MAEPPQHRLVVAEESDVARIELLVPREVLGKQLAVTLRELVRGHTRYRLAHREHVDGSIRRHGFDVLAYQPSRPNRDPEPSPVRAHPPGHPRPTTQPGL